VGHTGVDGQRVAMFRHWSDVMCDDKNDPGCSYSTFDPLWAMTDDQVFLAFENKDGWQAMRERACAIDSENRAAQAHAMDAWNVLKKHFDCNASFADKKKYENAMKKVRPLAPRPALDLLDYRIKQAEQRKREKESKQKDELAKNAENAKKMRKYLSAVKYLEARGWVINIERETPTISKDGLDKSIVDSDRLIELATEEAFTEAVNECISGMTESGEFTSFCGDDECSSCAGWNGVDNRCECGNRRVAWTRDGDFERLNVYAEAW